MLRTDVSFRSWLRDTIAWTASTEQGSLFHTACITSFSNSASGGRMAARTCVFFVMVQIVPHQRLITSEGVHPVRLGQKRSASLAAAETRSNPARRRSTLPSRALSTEAGSPRRLCHQYSIGVNTPWSVRKWLSCTGNSASYFADATLVYFLSFDLRRQQALAPETVQFEIPLLRFRELLDALGGAGAFVNLSASASSSARGMRQRAPARTALSDPSRISCLRKPGDSPLNSADSARVRKMRRSIGTFWFETAFATSD